MTLKPWRKISREVVRKNSWWTYFLDKVTLPSGNVGEYHYVHSPGSTMIIPVLPDGRVLAVNQFRYLARKESIEFPCGSMKDGTDFEKTAARELREETGYLAGQWTLVGEFNPYNGVTDEMCRVFLARELRYTGSEPDETEEFEMVPMTPFEFDDAVLAGSIWDGMSIAAWHLVRSKGLL
jgi:8-oxo-dGTP pyrophosphatase MutT (NUDIX family)